MMHTVVLLEIEELLFDTLAVRAAALHAALGASGVDVAPEAVLAAHTGVPAAIAIDRVSATCTIDALEQELITHRAAAIAREQFSAAVPTYAPRARDAIERAAAECVIAVVTRAEREQAHDWLNAAGLDGAVRLIRSLHGSGADTCAERFRDAAAARSCARPLAVVPHALGVIVARAGIRTLSLSAVEMASLDLQLHARLDSPAMIPDL
jgi:hypothetical protein